MAKQKDAKGFMRDMEKDLLTSIDVKLNQFVKEVVNDLTFGNKGQQVSPVLTGFFASSWKASTEKIAQKDRREDFPAWAKIQTTFAGGKTVLAPGYSPRIKRRHYVPRKFRIGEEINIGNTAEYTELALGPERNSARLINYILGSGGLDEKMNRIFSDDNRPNLGIKAEGGGLSSPTNYSDGYQDL